ncbi:MAG: hypothetical protein E7361_02885 [Clostridiales bacterium]|nr:hypothetical protein [Clostridiales bacterium]
MNTINNQLEEINKMYPYGQFPSKYTKKQKEPDNSIRNAFNYYTPDKFEKIQTMTTEKKEEALPQKEIDLKNILPLLTALSDHKKPNSSDLLSTILPLLLGKKSKDIVPLLKLMNNKSNNIDSVKKANSLPLSKYDKIDNYEKA